MKSDVETHRLAIPGTTTTLIIFYYAGLPMDRNVMRETLATARIHMSEQMYMYGDRTLLPVDDPYNTPLVEGADCTMKTKSQREPETQLIPHRLTYQVTLSALQGMFEFLCTDSHAVSAVSEDLDPGLTGSMTRVGVISIYDQRFAGVSG